MTTKTLSCDRGKMNPARVSWASEYARVSDMESVRFDGSSPSTQTQGGGGGGFVQSVAGSSSSVGLSSRLPVRPPRWV